MSLKEKIKEVKDIHSEVVHIEEWDCDIEVRTMTAKQRATILNSVMGIDGKIDNQNFHGYMIVASCYDPEDGSLVFSQDDIDWLMEKSSGPIEKLAGSVMRLSGLTKDALEQAEKN